SLGDHPLQVDILIIQGKGTAFPNKLRIAVPFLLSTLFQWPPRNSGAFLLNIASGDLIKKKDEY
ncbi:hypothetical protein, partial [Cohnella lupini]|uniref:hypothetical protein n=1 Tax=Cohnella lupini TaxID=1294267 RepID=UPI001C6EAFCB